MSCAAAGYCSAGGYYYASSGQQAFVIRQTHGTWGTAREVPGTAALNLGGSAEITSVSCASAGNCSAGGQCRASPLGFYQVFVVNEVNGTWGTAEEVPGSAALNPGGIGQINSVSCGSAGNCSAGGYFNGNSTETAFVVDETNGTWGTAQQVPGTTLGTAEIDSLSCASAGNCSAGGSYTNSGHQAFVVNETTAP